MVTAEVWAIFAAPVAPRVGVCANAPAAQTVMMSPNISQPYALRLLLRFGFMTLLTMFQEPTAGDVLVLELQVATLHLSL